MAGHGQGNGVAELLQAAVAAGLAPGFVACWGTPEKPRMVAFGLRGLGAGPTGPEVWYDLASLTKPLVTTTLVLLARRAGLHLRDPLQRFLPELAKSFWGKVTVGQCLTHTAGFPAWEPLYAQGDLSPQGYLRALGGIAPVASPGQEVVYSCLGFIALGLALERLGGASLAQLFYREVVKPLGLEDCLGFVPPLSTPVALGAGQPKVETEACQARGLSCQPPPPLAQGWSPDDGNARGLGGAAGNAGLFATAYGVFRLACAYLPGEGELLREGEKGLATALWTPQRAQARGLGWQLAATPGSSAGSALPARAFGHTGFTGISLWLDGEKRAVYVLLSNRLHPGGRTPDLHPLRRRFHLLASRSLRQGA
jgi:CubicO group peptidase (beta-lactamase class C family)